MIMSINAWDPGAEKKAGAIQLQPALLDRLIAYSTEDQLENLDGLIGAVESQELSGLMKVDHSAWHGATEHLPDDNLLHLIRFFVVAENLPGWEALDKSPVIPLAKILRKRGTRLDKEFLQWLRAVNSNRYLPYGPL